MCYSHILSTLEKTPGGLSQVDYDWVDKIVVVSDLTSLLNHYITLHYKQPADKQLYWLGILHQHFCHCYHFNVLN